MDRPIPTSISLRDFIEWENRQDKRYEWIDGTVTPVAGVSDNHSAIAMNVASIIHPALKDGPCFLRGSDRKLVPHARDGTALGSFYADLFVSCDSDDRKGSAAHFPTLVIEILSDHENSEFTKKRNAYLGSAKNQEYLIIDSTQQYAIRYRWVEKRVVSREYYRGSIVLRSIGVTLTFAEIFAETTTPFVMHPIQDDSLTENDD